MKHRITPTDWLPIVTTGALFLLVVFGVDAVARKSFADLAGLLFLLAAPFVFGAVRRWAPDRAVIPSPTGDSSDGATT